MDFKQLDKYSSSCFWHDRAEAPRESDFVWHCHPYYEVLYVIEGSGKYIIESAEYPIQPGTVLIVRPNEFHYLCPDSGTPYERYGINFESVAVKESLLRLSILKTGGKHTNGVYFPPSCVSDEIKALFHAIEHTHERFSETKHRESKEETMIMALLTQAILLLSLEAPERAVVQDDVISRIIEYLNLHLTEDISLDEISKAFFISKYYLCRAFRKHTGTSVFGYLSAKRIALAQTLLSNGDTATSVAYRVGFRNYSSFYRAYRKQTGTAPVKERES